MIYGIVGLPGSGKTYYSVYLALKDMKRGIKVYSNFWIEGAELYADLEQILTTVYNKVSIERGAWLASGKPRWAFEPTPTTIVVDEINLVCPARFWDTFNPQLAYFWSQSRKLGLNMYWTAQHQDRVDKIVREITNYIWRVKGIPIFKKYRHANCYDIIKIDTTKAQRIDDMWFKIKPETYRKYDTFDMISLKKELQTNYYKKKSWHR